MFGVAACGGIIVFVIAALGVIFLMNAFVVVGCRLVIEKICGKAWKSWVVRCTADAGLAGAYALIAGTIANIWQFNGAIETMVQTNFTGPYFNCAYPHHSYESTTNMANELASSDLIGYLRWMTAFHWCVDHVLVCVVLPMVVAGVLFHFMDTCGSARAKKPGEIF